MNHVRSNSRRIAHVCAAAMALGALPSLARAEWPPAVPPLAVAAGSREAALPPSVGARETPDGLWDVTWSLSLGESPATVSVAGDFNGWNRDALAMTRGADGVWRATARVKPGTVLYKFVLDGERWIADPKNPDGVDDGHEGTNSRVTLGALAALESSAAAIGDGAIEALAVEHRPNRATYLDDRADGTHALRYRTLAGDVESVEVVFPDAAPIRLQRGVMTDVFQYWEATLPPNDTDRSYTFLLRDGATVARHPETYTLRSNRPKVKTPDWAKRAVWYQIMPDRFRNAETANDPTHVRPWTSDWYEPSDVEKASGKGFYEYIWDRLYGGDLQGVRERLGYLKSLGVNAIYFTPIFQSPSLHRYDATSYVHVEELLGVKGDYKAAEAKEDLLDPSTWTWTGSDRVFLDFLKEAKRQGFRVIIDGVFNHVGTAHPAFEDVRERGKASRYADWFAIKSWTPFQHEGWAGFGGMPSFRKDETHGLASESLRKHIFDVTRRWMDPNGDGDPSDGVDGWRLDVPNEVPMAFWREWRALVKSINPDAYLVGEIWQQADDWVDGTTFDAVMNYQFAQPAIAWVGNRAKKLAPSKLDRRLAELRLAYPSEATYVMQNLLDSHDTDRIASMLMNPDRDYNRENRPQDGATNYVASKPDELAYRKTRLLALLQMTYVGAPMIWYGTEVGMWGSNDPTNRKPMLWKELEPYARPEENAVMEEQLAWYRAIGALRQRLPALQTGDFRTLLVDDTKDVWVFERSLGGERVIVALNASERDAEIALPATGSRTWREALATPGAAPSSPRFPTVIVPAVGGRVWESSK